MKIVIPSYNRPDILKQKTLKFLLEENYAPEDIYIFLKNDEQHVLYQQHIDEAVHFVVCNTNNLREKRQFICDYFPEGELILSVDDDIKRLKMIKHTSLRDFVPYMFRKMSEYNCKIWGVYPVNNLFFCKDRLRVGKQLVLFGFYGFVNTKDFCFPDVIKEDIWYSCYRSQKDGQILRYDGACMDTTLYTKGGLKEYRTLELEEKTCEAICNEFPSLVYYTVKKDGHPFCKWYKQNLIEYPFELHSTQSRAHEE